MYDNYRFLKHPIFLCLLCFVIFFSFIYQDFGGGLHNEYLVQYYRAQDPSYLTNDWYANTTQEYSVRFYFTYLLIFSSYILPYERVMFFCLTLFFTLGLGLALFYFGDYFYNDKKKALLFSLFAYATLDTTFIGTTVFFTTNITPNLIAHFFSFFSFNLILRKHYWLGFFFIGCGTLFQPIIGIISFVFGILILFYYLLLEKESFSFRKNTLYSPVSFLFVSLFHIVPLLSFSTKADPNLITYIFAYLRHPWHSLPSSWSLSLYFASFLLVLISLCFLYYSKIKDKKILVWLIGAGIFLTSLTYFFVEIYPITIFAKAQMSRAFAFVTIFSLLTIFDHIFIYFFKSKLLLEKFFLLCFLFSFFSYLFRYVFIVLGLVYLFFYYFPFFNKKLFSSIHLYFFFIICSFLFFLILFYRYDLIFSYSLTLVNLILLFSLFIFCSFLILSYNLSPNLFYSSFLIIILIFFFLPLSERDAPPLAKQQMCNFIQKNTDKSAVFLTPPVGPWHLCMKRALVIDFEAIPFNDESALQWYDRVLDVTNHHISSFDKNLNFNHLPLNEYYHTLNEKQILDLKHTYHFTFALFEKNMSFSFPLIYSENNYFLYELS